MLTFNRFMSLILVLVMIVGAIPTQVVALALEDNDTSPVVKGSEDTAEETTAPDSTAYIPMTTPETIPDETSTTIPESELDFEETIVPEETVAVEIASVYEDASESIMASGTCGENLTWVLDNTGTLTISGSGNMIESPWTNYKDKITTVVIDDGVTNIMGWAFSDCTNLICVDIPNSVTNIGGYAFRYCKNSISVTRPDGIPNASYCTFLGCRKLQQPKP